MTCPHAAELARLAEYERITCRKCLTEKTKSEFYFYYGRAVRMCKACCSEKGKKAHALRKLRGRPKRVKETTLERFWKFVKKTDTCWLWIGSTQHGGYGQFRDSGKLHAVHRYSYKLVAEIPDGLTIDHLCKVKTCVNPAHLEPVSMRENVLRSNGPAAINARKTHCQRGHEYSKENAAVYGRRRHCRACRAIRDQKTGEVR